MGHRSQERGYTGFQHILAATCDFSDVTWCGHPILSYFKDMGESGRFDTIHFSAWKSWEASPAELALAGDHEQLCPVPIFNMPVLSFLVPSS